MKMNRKFLNFIATLILLSMLNAPSMVQARSVLPSVTELSSFTFADLGESDLTIKDIYEQETIHFPFAAGQQAESATLKLHMEHSPKLLPSQSDFIIALNNEPVTNIILLPENAGNSTIAIDIPISAFHPGDNVLLFRFNIRLEENGCADIGSEDLWVKIFSDSSIEINATDTPPSPDLSLFASTFSSLSTLTGSPQISIILPPHPSRAELSAAAQISASLGQIAQWKNPPLWSFTFDKMDQTRVSNDNLIVIDTANRNPLVASSGSGVTESVSPYNPNRLMLIVSGQDDSTLQQSTTMITTQSARANLTGTYAASSPVNIQPAPEINPRAPFAGFSFETKRTQGIGLHDLYYGIEIPYDWKMTSEASIELHFRHGKSITSASLMTVFVNGFEVSSVRLDDSNADDGILVIQLSPRQIRAGRNWLHIVFDLHMPRENCKYRYFDEAWAEIPADKSFLNLAHVVSEPPVEISYLPSSMVVPTDLSDDMFILPESPTAAELSVMSRISAKLGSFSNADGMNIQAALADQIDVTTQPDLDVIAIGTPENNSLLAKYDFSLPQPLTLVNGAIVPAGNRTLLPEELRSEAGYVQALYAPWSSRSALVVVSAPNAEQLYMAANAFPSLGKRLKVEGNIAIVTANQVVGFNFGTFDAGAFLSTATRAIVITILIGTIFVMVIIGMVVARLRRKKELTNEDE